MTFVAFLLIFMAILQCSFLIFVRAFNLVSNCLSSLVAYVPQVLQWYPLLTSITPLHCSIIRLHICCYLLRACHVNIERLEINCNLNLWNMPL